jgi:predicted dehydrogenase
MAEMPRRPVFCAITTAGQRQHQNFADQFRWHPANRRQNSAMLVDVFCHLVALLGQPHNLSLHLVNLGI